MLARATFYDGFITMLGIGLRYLHAVPLRVLLPSDRPLANRRDLRYGVRVPALDHGAGHDQAASVFILSESYSAWSIMPEAFSC